MSRHNGTRRSREGTTDNFDRLYMDWPELPGMAKLVAMPLKTIYINRAAAPWANIDKVIFDTEELAAYLPNWLIW